MRIAYELGTEGSPWRDKAPTAKQLNLLREIAFEKGEGFLHPKTRGEASNEIGELIGDTCPECSGDGGFMSHADNAMVDVCDVCKGTGRVPLGEGEGFEDEWCQACNHHITEDDLPCPDHGAD